MSATVTAVSPWALEKGEVHKSDLHPKEVLLVEQAASRSQGD